MADRPTPTFTNLGVSGLARYAGMLFDEWLPDLQGYRGRKALREMMDNSAIIGAVLFGVEMLIRQTDWRIQADADDPQGDEMAEFIESCLHDMSVSWADRIGEICGFLGYGWQLHEISYKRRNGTMSSFTDNKIGWMDWPVRGQESLLRWEWDDKADIVTGMHQLGPPDWKPHFIPLEKALLFRTSVRRGSPEGHSILRNAYTSWYMQKNIQVIEAIGIERDLAGLPVAWVPAELLSATASVEEVATLEAIKKMVVNVKRDEQEGMVMPLVYDENGKEMYRFELMTSGGARQFNTDEIIARYEQRMAMSVLADFILLGQENVGSQSLGETKSKLFTAALGGWLDAICGVVNTQAIPKLLKLNGYNPDKMPTLEHGDVERVDLQELGQYLQMLSAANQRGAGFQLDTRPDGDLVKHLMQVADLPEPPEDLADLLPAELPTTPGVNPQEPPTPTQPKAPAAKAVPAETLGTQTTPPKAAPKAVAPKKASEPQSVVKAAEDEYAANLDSFFSDLRKR